MKYLKLAVLTSTLPLHFIVATEVAHHDPLTSPSGGFSRKFEQAASVLSNHFSVDQDVKQLMVNYTDFVRRTNTSRFVAFTDIDQLRAQFATREESAQGLELGGDSFHRDLETVIDPPQYERKNLTSC